MPGSTGQGTQCHCQENKDLRLINKVVEWRNQREEEPTGERKEKEAQICGSSPGQCSIAEVDSKTKRQDVEWLPEEPEGSWGLESGEVHQPTGRSDGGFPDRPRLETGKYHHRERRVAETIVLSPEWVRPVLQTTPGGASVPVRHWASCQMSCHHPVNRERPRHGQVVLSSCTPTLGVGENANRGTRKGSCPNRPTHSCLEAGEQGRNPQARKGQQHKTQCVSLQFSTKLHGESCRKSGCRATGWRGW